MNSVNLIISDNSQLKNSLIESGFSVNLFPHNIEPAALEKGITKEKDSISILEIRGSDLLNRDILSAKIELISDKTKLVCFSEAITHQEKKFLLKHGVSDCITDLYPERIIPYLKNLHTPAENKSGIFLVLDDREHHKKMIGSITGRFGYRTVIVSTVDDLFLKTQEPEIMLVLINIGTAGLDLNGLVRRSYSSSDLKRNPVIAYKCMDQGLFVHEIINGLNRLTKVIYSPEELYCMLTDMLFKKEIASYTGSLINSLRYDKLHPYASKSVQQIYYDHHGKHSSAESLFERGRIDLMISSAENIVRTLIRAEGLIWLRQNNEGVVTCGGAGV